MSLPNPPAPCSPGRMRRTRLGLGSGSAPAHPTPSCSTPVGKILEEAATLQWTNDDVGDDDGEDVGPVEILFSCTTLFLTLLRPQVLISE